LIRRDIGDEDFERQAVVGSEVEWFNDIGVGRIE
jgi:hypothetical protein